MQWLGAVGAVVTDAVSFVGSALFLARVRVAEPHIERASGATKPRLRQEIGEGLAYVWRHAMLRPIACTNATAHLFGSVIEAVFVVYAVRELRFSAGAVGVVFMLAGTGAVLGAVLCERASRPLGLGPAIVAAIALSSVGVLLVGLAPRQGALVFFVAGWGLSASAASSTTSTR